MWFHSPKAENLPLKTSCKNALMTNETTLRLIIWSNLQLRYVFYVMYKSAFLSLEEISPNFEFFWTLSIFQFSEIHWKIDLFWRFFLCFLSSINFSIFYVILYMSLDIEHEFFIIFWCEMNFLLNFQCRVPLNPVIRWHKKKMTS